MSRARSLRASTRFPSVRRGPRGRASELTVIAYGSAVPLALEAAEELDEDIEVIDLRTLNPLDSERSWPASERPERS